MAASTFPSARLGQGVGQKSLQVAKLPTNRPPSVCLLRPLTQNATRRKEVYLAATLCLPPSGGSLPLLVASAKQGGVLSPGGRAAEPQSMSPQALLKIFSLSLRGFCGLARRYTLSS